MTGELTAQRHRQHQAPHGEGGDGLLAWAERSGQRRPGGPALVSEADYIAAQDVNAARGPSPEGHLRGPGRRRYLLAGLLTCGVCGRRLESAWSNGKPAYRCRHGYTSATRPDPNRPKNAYLREDLIVPHLPGLHLLLTEPAADSAGGAPGAASTSGARPPPRPRSATCAKTR